MLKRDACHILRKTFMFEIAGKIKKWRLKRTWKKQVEKESIKVGLSNEDALSQSK